MYSHAKWFTRNADALSIQRESNYATRTIITLSIVCRTCYVIDKLILPFKCFLSKHLEGNDYLLSKVGEAFYVSSEFTFNYIAHVRQFCKVGRKASFVSQSHCHGSCSSLEELLNCYKFMKLSILNFSFAKSCRDGLTFIRIYSSESFLLNWNLCVRA